MINIKFQPLFITLLLALASCNGKPNAFGEGMGEGKAEAEAEG